VQQKFRYSIKLRYYATRPCCVFNSCPSATWSVSIAVCYSNRHGLLMRATKRAFLSLISNCVSVYMRWYFWRDRLQPFACYRNRNRDDNSQTAAVHALVVSIFFCCCFSPIGFLHRPETQILLLSNATHARKHAKNAADARDTMAGTQGQERCLF